MNIRYINRATGELITEKPPGEGFLKFLYYKPFGKLALNLLVKRKFFSAWYGLLMDKPKSVKKIPEFVSSLNIDMDESQKSISEFKSFNDFFYRKLKPNARPIGDGLVSPGDGKLLAFENIEDVNTFFVKGNDFTLKQYLQNDQLTDQFKNASLVILRLAPNDYHRYHFPYSGKVSKPHIVKGDYLSVSPYALAENFTRVFCENERTYTLLETKDKGTILVSPVGATMVGSIIHTYANNTSINKGDEMGYFAFGGSTVVLLVDKAHFSIDKDLLENTKNNIETAVKMGEKIGS